MSLPAFARQVEVSFAEVVLDAVVVAKEIVEPLVTSSGHGLVPEATGYVAVVWQAHHSVGETLMPPWGSAPWTQFGPESVGVGAGDQAIVPRMACWAVMRSSSAG